LGEEEKRKKKGREENYPWENSIGALQFHLFFNCLSKFSRLSELMYKKKKKSLWQIYHNTFYTN
jgi:hypothetical protein